MSNHTVVAFKKEEDIVDPLTALLRHGARQLLQNAIDAELGELLATHRKRKDAHGRGALVRNGYLPTREVLTGIGSVAVKVPKVRDRLGTGVVFHSALAPPYVRHSRSSVARTTLLALVYKLAMSAEKNFFKIRGFHRLAEVVAGVRFKAGVKQDEGAEKGVTVTTELQQDAA